jgi:acyl-CoA reductase-like NAD-dependent aldehyde dehydrogenase
MTDSGYDRTPPAGMPADRQRIAGDGMGWSRAAARPRARSSGLGSYFQTSDLRRAHRVAERLVAGNTMINGAPNMMANCPVGGFGLSGLGNEGGPEGLAEFQRIQTVAMLRPGIGALD